MILFRDEQPTEYCERFLGGGRNRIRWKREEVICIDKRTKKGKEKQVRLVME